jgi:DNA-binding winged helix-turn-helix (wHTH) protein
MRARQPVPLNPKAFDLLAVLVENRGHLMTKDQLLKRVWPNQFVEEGNLTVHMSAVRKALGERKNGQRYIVTVPGRGYQFVAAEIAANEGFVVEERTLSRMTIEQPEAGFGDQPLSHTTNFRPGESSLPEKTVYLESHRVLPMKSILAAAIVIGLGLGALIGYRLLINRRAAGALAAESSRGGRNMLTKQLTAEGDVSTAALSPDGNYFAYVFAQDGNPGLRPGQCWWRQSSRVAAAGKGCLRLVNFCAEWLGDSLSTGWLVV